MNCSFGQAGCQKMVVKIGEIFFRYMRVMYIKRKLRTCQMQIQKEKVQFFVKKIGFWKFWNFFPKGDPLMWKLS